MSKTTDMALLEALDPERRDIESIIRDAYWRAGSLRGAGALMGVNGSTLCRWMRRLGLRLAVVPEGEAREECAA